MHHALAIPFLALLLTLAMTHSAHAQPNRDALHRLFADYFAWRMEEFPEMAMQRGDYRNAHMLSDISRAGVERRHQTTIDFLARLHRIERDGLDETDLVSYEMFERELRQSIEGHGFRTFLTPITGRWGFHTQVPQMNVGIRFQTLDDYRNYLTRIELLPGRAQDTIDLMRQGLAEGRTPPRVTLHFLPGQIEATIRGGLAGLESPLLNFPVHITPDQRDELTRRFHETSLPAARRSLEALHEFVINEYLPNCRETIAAIDWPEGEAYYNFVLSRFTTTDLTAREIHEIGLSEVARIRAEMMEVIRRSDFMQLPEVQAFASVEDIDGSLRTQTVSRRPADLDDDDLFRAFIHYLRTDPRFYHTSAEDLLAGYREICKRVDPELARLFRTLPRLPYGVAEIPRFMAPTQTTAYYRGGNIENAEPGWFYANTYALDQRPRYEMVALALHEAVPGHHLQIALAQELEDLPEFRRYSSVTVFVEGWALYSERLGIEMGMYDDPYDDFGRLLYEMWRATRLVVDPGMHALGWTRQQAIDFMLANTALSEHNITTEVDRYIGWPGQATAYKIGELKIRELRRQAETTLGERFDIRAFHDVVLGAGAVPLDVLERRVEEWIANRRR